MKQFLFLFSVFFCLSIKSQVNFPSYINYQAVVRDANGEPITANTNVNLTFKLYDSFVSSVFSYEENHTVSTSNFGYVSVQIGKGTPTGTATINNVNWAGGQVCYEVYLNNSTTPISPKQNFASTPYSFYALQSGSNSSSINNTTITSTGIITSTPNSVSSNAYTLNVQPPVFSSASVGSISLINYPNYSLSIPPASLSINGNSITLSQGTVVSTETLSILSSTGTANYLPVFSSPSSFVNSNLYKTPTNRLGINTTSPSSFLHALTPALNDTLLIENPFNGSTAIGLKNSFNYFALSLTGSTLKIQDINSTVNDRMVFAGGKIGVGTSSPAFPFEITSTSLTPFQINSSNGSGASMYINAINNTTSPKYGYKVAGIEKSSHYLNSNGDWNLDVNSTNAITVLAANGNVGIANSLPTAKFQVGGNTIFRDINSSNGFVSLIENNTAIGLTGGALKVVNNNVRNQANTALAIENNATSTLPGTGTKIGLDVRSTGAWSAGFGQINVGLISTAVGADFNYSALFFGGNVGVGTSSPKSTLGVNGGISVKVNQVTGAYTPSSGDCIIVNFSAGTSINLPNTANIDDGAIFIIRNLHFFAVVPVTPPATVQICLIGSACTTSPINIPVYGTLRLYKYGNLYIEF